MRSWTPDPFVPIGLDYDLDEFDGEVLPPPGIEEPEPEPELGYDYSGTGAALMAVNRKSPSGTFVQGYVLKTEELKDGCTWTPVMSLIPSVVAYGIQGTLQIAFMYLDPFNPGAAWLFLHGILSGSSSSNGAVYYNPDWRATVADWEKILDLGTIESCP